MVVGAARPPAFSGGTPQPLRCRGWLQESAAKLNPMREETRLRGFGEESFQVWRLTRLEDIGGSAPPS